jgi:phosphohistidine phosphatase SixA
MTRDIILLRHAEAEPPRAEEDDTGRPLTAHGIDEAAAAGRWLAEHAAAPAIILSSPATRALATAEAVSAALGAPAPRVEADVYEATPGDLIRVLDRHADAACLLLVGHNPGLERLVALLSTGSSDDGRGMPPAAIAWLGLASGVQLEPGTAGVRHFWWP